MGVYSLYFSKVEDVIPLECLLGKTNVVVSSSINVWLQFLCSFTFSATPAKTEHRFSAPQVDPDDMS